MKLKTSMQIKYIRRITSIFILSVFAILFVSSTLISNGNYKTGKPGHVMSVSGENAKSYGNETGSGNNKGPEQNALPDNLTVTNNIIWFGSTIVNFIWNFLKGMSVLEVVSVPLILIFIYFIITRFEYIIKMFRALIMRRRVSSTGSKIESMKEFYDDNYQKKPNYYNKAQNKQADLYVDEKTVKYKNIGKKDPKLKIDKQKKESLNLAPRGLTDIPLRAKDPASYWLSHYSCALSRFIMNRDTKPPITFAVTGEWGIGKSSFMNLVRDELKDNNYRTVMFNAWHHQNEQHMLASLLEAVKKQALPPVYRLDGIWARAKLLWKRAKTSLFLSLLLLGLACIYINYKIKVDNPVRYIVAWALPMVLLFLQLKKKASALGINFNILTNPIKKMFKMPGFKETIGFRQKFAEAFGQLTDSLDNRHLVILIDDLDRCKGTNVVEILEAINFLTSNGHCFFILGLDPDWIKACLSVEFKSIAEAMSELKAGGDESSERKKEEMDKFVTNYLEKLINIEVPVPRLTTKQVHSEYDPGLEEKFIKLQETRKKQSILKNVAQIVPGILLLGLMSFGLLFCADWVNKKILDKKSTVSQETTKSGHENNDAGGNDENIINRKNTVFGLSLFVFYSLLTLGTILTILSIIWSRRITGIRIEDSKKIREVLQLWEQVAFLYHQTPRSIKQFANKVRYFSMMQETDKETPEKVTPQVSLKTLIAMVAVQHFNPRLFTDKNFWKRVNQIMKNDDGINQLFEDGEGVENEKILLEVINKSADLFGSTDDFPPSADLLKEFKNWESRIRVR